MKTTVEQRGQFRDEVEEFIRLYCGEYMLEASVEYEEPVDDYDPPTATVKMEDHHHRKWEIPLLWNGEEAAIDIGDAGTLHADGEGFYCFLWHEACGRLSKN